MFSSRHLSYCGVWFPGGGGFTESVIGGGGFTESVIGLLTSGAAISLGATITGPPGIAASTIGTVVCGLTLVQTCAILPCGSIRNVFLAAIPFAPSDPYALVTFFFVSANKRNVRFSVVQNC